jgi:hypothetical protein
MQDLIGRALRRSYVRTVADVWIVTERRTGGNGVEQNSYSSIARHEQGFLSGIVSASAR